MSSWSEGLGELFREEGPWLVIQGLSQYLVVIASSDPLRGSLGQRLFSLWFSVLSIAPLPIDDVIRVLGIMGPGPELRCVSL